MDAERLVIGPARWPEHALHCALAGGRRGDRTPHRRITGFRPRAGLFKSIQADELRTRLARRSITPGAQLRRLGGSTAAVARSGVS